MVFVLLRGEERVKQHTSISIAGAAGLAFARVIADAVAVDVAGPEGVGAGGALAEVGGGREGLVLAHLQLAGEELVQVTGESAGGEKGGRDEIDGMHFGGFYLLGCEKRALGSAERIQR